MTTLNKIILELNGKTVTTSLQLRFDEYQASTNLGVSFHNCIDKIIIKQWNKDSLQVTLYRKETIGNITFDSYAGTVYPDEISIGITDTIVVDERGKKDEEVH